MSEEKGFSTALAKVNDTYFPMIEDQLIGNGIKMDDYSKKCVLNAISSINNSLDQKGIDWNDKQLDHSNITEILLNVASLKLNSSASPNEVFFQVRNVKHKKNGKDEWKKQIEMGIEGDGNDAILSRFGRGVKNVHQFWLVREDDDFTYPSYVGIDVEPPHWTPKGTGKVVRVVYPIEKDHGTVEYHIGEREDVLKNLIAHVNNNLMNETFGIAKNRFNATASQKQEIQKKKNEIIESIEAKGLDEALKDESLMKHISPAWKDEQSKESMIIRKMRNNIVKRIPKDFGVALVEMSYEDSSNDVREKVRKDITENANNEVIDFPDFEKEEENTQEEAQEDSKENEQESSFVEVIDSEEKEPMVATKRKEKEAPF